MINHHVKASNSAELKHTNRCRVVPYCTALFIVVAAVQQHVDDFQAKKNNMHIKDECLLKTGNRNILRADSNAIQPKMTPE